MKKNSIVILGAVKTETSVKKDSQQDVPVFGNTPVVRSVCSNGMILPPSWKKVPKVKKN